MSASLIASYKEPLLFLATAGIVVPLFRRLRINRVIGFILAGVFLGPHVLGRAAQSVPALSWFSFGQVEEIAHLAEFGVVFLLFMIGLELSFERLSRLRRLVFGLGAVQVGVSTLVIAQVAWMLGQGLAASFIIGAAFALSSTAIVIPVLAENKRLNSTSGRVTFSVLLFQDLMVAPLLFGVSMLASRDQAVGLDFFYAFAPALLALVVLVGLGRLVLRPLFHLVVRAGSTEFFMAACLLVVLGASLITAAAGLSLALGAFIGGLLLAETEFRREIEVTIEPFQGLLLGLFFVSVGATLNVAQILDHPFRIVGLALALTLGKIVVFYLAARVFKVPMRSARDSALMIGPGGEFAFVLITAALGAKLLPAPVANDLITSVTLSMLSIPALAALSARLRAGTSSIASPEMQAPEGAAEDRVIVVGFGRVGQLVADMLTRHKIPYIAVDGDPLIVGRARSEGAPIYWGNAQRPEFLRRCGVGRARALVVTINAPKAAEEIVAAGRAERADLTIVARARDAAHATHLYKLGASDAIPETIEASLQLSEAVLVDIGVPMGYVIASIHEKRDEYRKLLQPLIEERPQTASPFSRRVLDRQRKAVEVEQKDG